MKNVNITDILHFCICTIDLQFNRALSFPAYKLYQIIKNIFSMSIYKHT